MSSSRMPMNKQKRPASRISPFAITSAAAVASCAVAMTGCHQGKTIEPLIGMKVQNLSPLTITANYSLVSDGSVDGTARGSVIIPPMWDNSTGLAKTDEHSIGNDVSQVEFFFTSYVGDDASSKCSMYEGTAAQQCESVSAVHTQFQVAFPTIAMSFGQEFSFYCTSAGGFTGDSAEGGQWTPGQDAWANCSSKSCSGLGIGTQDPDGTMHNKNNLFALMPGIEKNPSAQHGDPDEYQLTTLSGKDQKYSGANIPVFVFMQSQSPAVCDSSLTDGDLSCQALKKDYITGVLDPSELSATAAKCIKSTCAFEPALYGTSCTKDSCDGKQDECMVEGMSDETNCNAPDPISLDYCYEKAQNATFARTDSFTAVSGESGAAPICSPFCNVFKDECREVIFDVDETGKGSGEIKDQINKAIQEADYKYLSGLDCNGQSVAARLLWNVDKLKFKTQIAFNNSTETCSVTHTTPTTCDSNTCPNGKCVDGKCVPNQCQYGTGQKGNCENPACQDDGVDPNSGYCQIPAGCRSTNEDGSRPTSDAEIACGCDPDSQDPSVCGDCGTCAQKDSDGFLFQQFNCTMTEPTTCDSGSVCSLDGDKYTCSTGCSEDSDCGFCGHCNAGQCEAVSQSANQNNPCGCGECTRHKVGSAVTFTCEYVVGTCGSELCLPNPDVDGSFSCQESPDDCTASTFPGCGDCGKCNTETKKCQLNPDLGTACETSSTGACFLKQDYSNAGTAYMCQALGADDGCGECGKRNLQTGKCMANLAGGETGTVMVTHNGFCFTGTGDDKEYTGQCVENESENTFSCEEQTCDNECGSDGSSCGKCDPAFGVCVKDSSASCTGGGVCEPAAFANDRSFECDSVSHNTGTCGYWSETSQNVTQQIALNYCYLWARGQGFSNAANYTCAANGTAFDCQLDATTKADDACAVDSECGSCGLCVKDSNGTTTCQANTRAGVCSTNHEGNYQPNEYCKESSEEGDKKTFECTPGCLWGDNKFEDKAGSCENEFCTETLGLEGANLLNGACRCPEGSTNLSTKHKEYNSRGFLCECMSDNGCASLEGGDTLVAKGDYGGAPK